MRGRRPSRNRFSTCIGQGCLIVKIEIVKLVFLIRKHKNVLAFKLVGVRRPCIVKIFFETCIIQLFIMFSYYCLHIATYGLRYVGIFRFDYETRIVFTQETGRKTKIIFKFIQLLRTKHRNTRKIF